MAVFEKRAVEFIREASRNTYPEEFIALLRKNSKGAVSEVIVVPLSVYGDGFSSINFSMLPLTSDVCGSVHSHPSPVNWPSRGDLLFFSRIRGIHAIIGYPYRQEDIAAYDERGKPLPLEIIDSAERKKKGIKGARK